MTNDYLRANAIAQSERNIAFLGQEAAKTYVVGVKQAICEILQSEIRKEMLARGSEEYAFRILDRALPPERAASPRKLLWDRRWVLRRPGSVHFVGLGEGHETQVNRSQSVQSPWSPR
jgi:hypothetical protein